MAMNMPQNAPEAPQDLQEPGDTLVPEVSDFWSEERQKAYAFMVSGVSFRSIALALGRSELAVLGWAKASPWVARVELERANRAAFLEEALSVAETAAVQSLPAHASAKGGGMIALEVLDRRRVLERRPDKLANADGSNLPAGVVVVLRPAAPPDEPVLELGADDVKELGEVDPPAPEFGA
jgi:hypothetical protein